MLLLPTADIFQNHIFFQKKSFKDTSILNSVDLDKAWQHVRLDLVQTVCKGYQMSKSAASRQKVKYGCKNLHAYLCYINTYKMFARFEFPSKRCHIMKTLNLHWMSRILALKCSWNILLSSVEHEKKFITFLTRYEKKVCTEDML